MPKGRSYSKKSSFCRLFMASRINPSLEMNSLYIRSAPCCLQTYLKGGSLTSSMGARRSGKEGSCILPTFITIKSQNYALKADFPSVDTGIKHMLNKARNPSPRSQLFLFVGLLAAMFFAFSLLYFVIDQLAHGTHTGPGTAMRDTASIDFDKFLQVLFTVMVFGLPGLLYARFSFPDRPWYQLGLRPASRNSFYLLAILLLLCSL